MNFKYKSFIFYSLIFISVVFQSCQEPSPEIEIIELDDGQAIERAEQIRAEVSVELAEGLQIDVWASEEMIKDPVALHLDDYGQAWVTMTNRSNSSEFDIRRWPQWTTESLRFRNVGDRRSFLREFFSYQRSEQNADVMPDRNEDGVHDWRDLTVEKEEVHVIEDVTGNGYANRSQLFIRDFHQEITDVAASVLYHEGDVFVGVAPDMWRLRDTTGDGMADNKESISHGYGVHISIWGHGMSGLTVGPDGRIYWSIGDPGFNVIDQEGNHWDYPHQGAIFRSEPDGSNFEVFARGLRNTHEFAFDKYGNLITVDNDGDFPGEFERLLYVINGADGGWRTHWQFGKYNDAKNNTYNVWSHERYYHPPFDGQAAHVLPSLGEFHNGPAGMAYNPGTALHERWNNHFFIVSFVGSPVRSAINAITLEPDGAAFRLAGDEPFLSGIAGSGLDFGPDGSLYVADWIQGWSQNQQGRIWKIDATDGVDRELREDTRQLLGSSFAEFDAQQLMDLMGHADMRVRQKAQFELADREAADELGQAIDDNKQLRRIHGIWGMGQLGRKDPDNMYRLLGWMEDEDVEIRAQVAKVLGDVRYEPAATRLIERLRDENPRVQFFAAEALGRIAYQSAFDDLIEMLEDNDDEDLFLRQAGFIALQRLGDSQALAGLSDHPSRAVRIAGVVALRNLQDPAVAGFLDDEDEFIVTNAARAISDDSLIEQAIPALAGLLDQHQFTSEPLLRRVINAAQINATQQDAHHLADFALRDDVNQSLRVEALEALSVWTSPSPLDRVSGRYRGERENDHEDAWSALAQVMDRIFETPEAVRVAGVEAIRGLGYQGAYDELVQLVETDEAAYVREAALAALHELAYEDMDRVFAVAIEDDDAGVRGRALEMLPASGIDYETLVSLIERFLEQGLQSEQQQAMTVLGQIDHLAVYDLLGRYLDTFIDGNLQRELELELIEAVREAGQEPLISRLEAYRQEIQDDNPVVRYGESLYGGDGERGRTIFYEHAAGQCMRCHVVDGSGSDVGPDLSDAGSRLSRDLLLQSLVAPDRRIAPGYGTVHLSMQDGTTIQGLVVAKTEYTMTIRSDGQSQVIQHSDIAERISATSGMPPMGDILSRQELRDLVEYMTGLQ